MAKDSKVRFSSPTYQWDYTKSVTDKIDIEYYNTIASDYEQCQPATCLGYINLKSFAK
jgi:hypothetical protein